MPSKRQIQANQNNAQKSTGPKTPEGKAVCAANAITHGFSAQHAVLPSESSEGFQALLARLEDEFRPQSAIEQSLIRHLADADWRLRRAATFESAVLLQRVERLRRNTDEDDNDLPEDPVFDEICLLGRALISDADGSDPLSKISRHEARLTRRYFKALAQLRKARKDRHTGPTPPPPQTGQSLNAGRSNSANRSNKTSQSGKASRSNPTSPSNKTSHSDQASRSSKTSPSNKTKPGTKQSAALTAANPAPSAASQPSQQPTSPAKSSAAKSPARPTSKSTKK
jgi:hypothetical protein